ncbi:hypothetical protein C2857_002997 [Epichloe festucae Fl1]|uniref:Uncharacterized protein n=1 Tax=Epichloe festucae (strain Fl1) TaxID=877507 RepID=A0A7U3Q1X9_EPIFF|nr:hypothetical protein C2857_002997 [Epichloe festucae Fl1]
MPGSNVQANGTGQAVVNGNEKKSPATESFAIERFRRDDGPWHQPFDTLSSVRGGQGSPTRRNNGAGPPSSVHQGSQAPKP